MSPEKKQEQGIAFSNPVCIFGTRKDLLSKAQRKLYHVFEKALMETTTKSTQRPLAQEENKNGDLLFYFFLPPGGCFDLGCHEQKKEKCGLGREIGISSCFSRANVCFLGISEIARRNRPRGKLDLL